MAARSMITAVRMERPDPGLTGTLEVESVGFSDGWDARVRMIPGSRVPHWVNGGAIYQRGGPWERS